MKRHDLIELALSLRGLPVLGCLAGSPAARAGIRYGDVLLALDGQPTESWDAYLRIRSDSGRVLRMMIFRDGLELEVEVPLDDGAPRSIAELLADLETSNASGLVRPLGEGSD